MSSRTDKEGRTEEIAYSLAEIPFRQRVGTLETHTINMLANILSLSRIFLCVPCYATSAAA